MLARISAVLGLVGLVACAVAGTAVAGCGQIGDRDIDLTISGDKFMYSVVNRTLNSRILTRVEDARGYVQYSSNERVTPGKWTTNSGWIQMGNRTMKIVIVAVDGLASGNCWQKYVKSIEREKEDKQETVEAQAQAQAQAEREAVRNASASSIQQEEIAVTGTIVACGYTSSIQGTTYKFFNYPSCDRNQVQVRPGQTVNVAVKDVAYHGVLVIVSDAAFAAWNVQVRDASSKELLNNYTGIRAGQPYDVSTIDRPVIISVTLVGTSFNTGFTLVYRY
jgi:hypothetical protein